MDPRGHPRAWRIAAPALLGWNVLGGAVGGTVVVVAVFLSPSGGTAAFSPDSLALTILVVAVAAILGAVGGLLGGGTLVLARGRRPTPRTLVRGLAAGLVVAALVVLAALFAPIMPDATRPIAVVVGLAIGAVMLGLAFQSHAVHWREEEPTQRDLPGGDAPAYATDPIRDLVDPDPHAADDDVAAGR
ncbi:hypothetical protein [Agrococcus sp. SGAir0287]|uniref:hypothetical protein n=1 Tax=Agrococcus sp. SGAir0287 TaxID=2070347 RepID=UPI0010CD00C3|nr:hypothetical protein [Agrococcus sp. SGAir0287]QCR20197.1 hypothetical protein C1N71_12730 [Agrococcus sp. SGAir0287]